MQATADAQPSALPLEQFNKTYSHSAEWKMKPVPFVFGVVSAQSQGFSNLLPR
jgi:hypothetical protein